MKLYKKSPKSALNPILLGLSEDEHYYCLVKKEAEKFTVCWQKKPYDVVEFLQKATFTNSFSLIRSIPHEYIWRKTIFLSKTLDEIQLHQQIIHILKKDQPLPLENLNIDYQKSAINNDSLEKITIYALRKSYANNLYSFPCILDCELHCYMRAITHLTDIEIKTEFPSFIFNQKIIQFTEIELRFPKIKPKQCIKVEDIAIPNLDIDSDNAKHLYLLALGASLWNGKALI